MDIKVVSSQLHLGHNVTLTKEEAIEYARQEVEKAAAIFDAGGKSATIVLSTEGLHTDPVQKVDVTLVICGHKVVQSAHSRSIKKAIDRACASLRRQVQRQKTRVTESRRDAGAKAKRNAEVEGGIAAAEAAFPEEVIA